MQQIRAIARMNNEELAKGVSGTDASWHVQYRGNAWIFAGGLSEELTEGDVLAVFSQYGEIEDLHLVRDKETGKSKGFAFLKYEDERSTVLAVDNFNGATLLGNTLRVDHTNYRPPKKKKKEIEADEAHGVAHTVQSAGHAYVGKTLKTGHDLEHGVNLFDNPAADPRQYAGNGSGGGAGESVTATASAAAEQDPMQGYVDEAGGTGSVAKRRRDDANNNNDDGSKREQKRLRKKAKKEAKKAKKAEKKAKKKAKKAKKQAKKKAKKKKKGDQPAALSPGSSASSASSSSSSEDDDEDAQLRAAQAFLQGQQRR